MYKVQKNIPIPGRRTQAGKKTNFIKRLDIKIAARRIDNHKLRIWIVEKDGEKLDEQE